MTPEQITAAARLLRRRGDILYALRWLEGPSAPLTVRVTVSPSQPRTTGELTYPGIAWGDDRFYDAYLPASLVAEGTRQELAFVDAELAALDVDPEAS